MNRHQLREARHLLGFMIARHDVYLARERGDPWPWTGDEILGRYRFTNVFRELDRTTVWIDRHVRSVFAPHPNLWFMLALSRVVNRVESLDALVDTKLWPLRRWDQDLFYAWVLERRAARLPTFNAAYMVLGVIKYLGELWARRLEVEPHLHGSMQEAHAALRGCRGWGRFMRYELVCDLRFTRYLEAAPDAETWTSCGPGSARGLNRVLGRGLNERWRDGDYLAAMRDLYPHIKLGFVMHYDQRGVELPPFEMRELEHSLCEWDKFERVRLGEGKPKQLYGPEYIYVEA